jgi:hypothetical protein
MHEGAASGPYFSLDKSYPVYATHTKMSKVLDKAGFFFEECTGYYVAVYAKEEA